MIDFNELLSPDRILCKCDLKSRKRSLQTLAELLAANLDNEEVSEMDILDALISREKLGSTALGHGVALPHGRIKHLAEPMAAVITLQNGVDFEAPDDETVDLMTGLIVPENCDQEHLDILASLAKVFSQPALRQNLRDATEPTELRTIFLQSMPTAPAEDTSTAQTATDGKQASNSRSS